MTLSAHLNQSIKVIQSTAADPILLEAVERSIDLIVGALSAGLPVLVCGNGGSACDALHISGELVGRFLRERRALNVIALSDNVCILTALANDYGYDSVFARQVEAYAQPGAVLVGLSTSGNSPNVVRAFTTAGTLGMKTIAFTGTGGTLASHSDVTIAVPSREVPYIQQVHSCIYHYVCDVVEQRMMALWHKEQTL